MTYKEAIEFLGCYEIESDPYSCTYMPYYYDEKYKEAVNKLEELVNSLDQM